VSIHLDVARAASDAGIVILGDELADACNGLACQILIHDGSELLDSSDVTADRVSELLK
jgi:hypothetical protein